MDEEKKEERVSEGEDLTPREEAEVEDTGMSGEEAHRYEEFRELEAKLDRVLEVLGKVNAQLESLHEGFGVMVDNGAVVNDTASTNPIDEILVDDPETLPVEIPLTYDGDLDLTVDDDKE